MNIKYLVIGVSILLISFLAVYFLIKKREVVAIKNGDQARQYGSVIPFRENEIIVLPDFRIRYVGQTSKEFTPPSGNNSRKFVFRYENFVVMSQDSSEQAVSWSAGTGDVGPVEFSVGGAEYKLELQYSTENSKRLSENEMVISKSEKR